MVSFKHILVAVDFGESSKEALAVAIDLSKQYGAALTVMHTWEIPMYGYGPMDLPESDLLTPIHGAARKQLDELLAAIRSERPDVKAILSRGVPWREIRDAIEQHKPDLVVMGTHGRRGVGRALLGSVAEKIVRTSPVPVLTVPSKTKG